LLRTSKSFKHSHTMLSLNAEPSGHVHTSPTSVARSGHTHCPSSEREEMSRHEHTNSSSKTWSAMAHS